MENKTQTIPITNFSGTLTRVPNGELNSGKANFKQSWGYDPFSKPGNLTWLEQPQSILGTAPDLLVAAKPRVENGASYVYAIGTGSVAGAPPSNSNVYKIQTQAGGIPGNPTLDSVVGISSVMGGLLMAYGSSIELYGDPEALYYSTDRSVVVKSLTTFAAQESVIGGAPNIYATFHPLKQFAGNLYFGNKNTIGTLQNRTLSSSVIGTGDNNLTSGINPPLPVENYVHDLDVSQDGNYLLITASDSDSEEITQIDQDYLTGYATNGYIYGFNGSDVTVTSANNVPSYAITALQTYLQNNMFFSADSFGTALNDGVTKLLTLTNNKPPLPNATAINGNFITWANTEVTPDGTGMVASLYYYGALDQENPTGLYRLMRYTSTLSNGFVYQVPLNMMTGNKIVVVKAGAVGMDTISYGKHYVSVFETSPGTQKKYTLLRFLVTSTGTGVPQLGTYETQSQLFSKKQTVKQIRVYTEPTATGNGFQIDFIGSDGSVVTPTNGVFTYTYAAGTDPTVMQGSLERIDYNPQLKSSYVWGVRVTNTGTTNMTIKKIELDIQESGK